MKKTVLFMVAMAMLAGCAEKSAKVPAIDLSDFDNTTSAGTDFYQYVNGGWMKKNPLRAEYARYGSFDVLREANEKNLNELFSSMTTMKTVPGSVEQKISDLYKMGLDSVRLNNEGCAPLKKYIEQIYAAQTSEDLVKLVAAMHKSGDEAFFGTGVDADLMDSNVQVLYLGQGGLGIGDRDYYVDEANAEIKAGYKAFLAKAFAVAEASADPQQSAANTVAIEDKLAEMSWTSVENRDYTKLYNPMTVSQVAETFKGFDFAAYFKELGVDGQQKVIVEQPSFFEGFSALFASTPVDQLKDYIAAHFISGAAGAVNDELYTASFEFFSRQLSGITEQKPRWKRAMQVPNSLLGEAVGQMYVQKYFPEASKAKVLELVNNLRTALGEHIDALEWMSDQTKAYAREKLAAFTVKIGYPDKWKDYSTLAVDPSLSYFENLRSASEWYVKDNFSKLGKPTDKTEWGMTPQTVNAYYNPTTNEICFPAAILQPPFFNPDADDAVNYGAIGVVICHEMTHGFDDQGRLFDKNGNMTNWWTEEDDAAFKERAQILAAQFDEIEVVPGSGVHANGQLSLGENIADHGGVSIAYSALQNSFAGKHPEPVDGFTAEQRFFIGYAHVWAQNATNEEKLRLTKLDVHSLAENRVNATLRNFGTFFDAFGIKEGDPMFRPESERVHIW